MHIWGLVGARQMLAAPRMISSNSEAPGKRMKIQYSRGAVDSAVMAEIVGPGEERTRQGWTALPGNGVSAHH